MVIVVEEVMIVAVVAVLVVGSAEVSQGTWKSRASLLCTMANVSASSAGVCFVAMTYTLSLGCSQLHTQTKLAKPPLQDLFGVCLR